MGSLKLSTCLDAISATKSLPELHDALLFIKDFYDFTHLAFHFADFYNTRPSEPILLLTYPQEWIDHYQRNDFFRIDPVVKIANQGFLPVDWSRLDWNGCEVESFVNEAQAFGIGTQGFTIPVHGPHGQKSLMSATSDFSAFAWSRHRVRYLPDIHFLAHHLHSQITKLVTKSSHGAGLLSVRETQCINLIASGFQAKQIACKLEISEGAVRQYLASARRKLGSGSLTQAIVRATKLGLIL